MSHTAPLLDRQGKHVPGIQIGQASAPLDGEPDDLIDPDGSDPAFGVLQSASTKLANQPSGRQKNDMRTRRFGEQLLQTRSCPGNGAGKYALQ